MKDMTSGATVRRSILDRLIDEGGSEPGTWAESVEALKASVVRDLMWLLNARQTGERAGDPYDEVERSIYNYGLLDFASMSAEDATTGARVAREIERTIELFEPRLAAVSVRPAESTGGVTAPRRFLIHASLRLDPDPDRVEFDTVLEVSSGHFRPVE